MGVVRGRTTSDGDVEFYESDTGAAISSIRGGSMSGAAPTIADSEAADAGELVTDFNALLAALRNRGVIA